MVAWAGCLRGTGRSPAGESGQRSVSSRGSWEPEAGSGFVGLGRHRREFELHSENMPEERGIFQIGPEKPHRLPFEE